MSERAGVRARRTGARGAFSKSAVPLVVSALSGFQTTALAALIAGTLCSCGAGLTKQTVRPLATEGTVEGALHRIKPLDSGESRLLYFYERGLILHDGGQYHESNEALDKAEDLLEDLYTKSLTRELGGLMIGDYLVQYRGERFEASLVYYYKIMNYLRLGDVNGAAVECRRLNHRLQLFRDAGGSFYVDDPFLQYLTGLVYAAAGERPDADVSLRVALDSYRSLCEPYGAEIPSTLLCDLADNAAAGGHLADAESYRKEGHCPSPARSGAMGSLRLFLECGNVPLKVEESLVLPIYKNEITGNAFDRNSYCRELSARRGLDVDKGKGLEYLLKVALPVMHPAPGTIRYARVRALPLDSAGAAAQAGAATAARSVVAGDSSALQSETVVAQNVAALALKSFEERQGEIFMRAIARSLAKYLATKAAEGKEDKDKDKKKKDGFSFAPDAGNKIFGKLVNLLGVATESADTRCWSALPEKILMAGLDLPPGKYRVEVEVFGSDRQRVGFFSLPEVEIAKGGSTILSHRMN